MSPALKVLAALVAGLSIGLAASASEASWPRTFAASIEPLGRIWVNAIRMTVLPLVGAMLVAGVVGSDHRAVGRVGGRAALAFVVLVAAAALLTAVVTPTLLAWLPTDPAAAAALRNTVGAAVPDAAQSQVPTVQDWLVGLVPVNPVGAMAQGTMLPFIIFVVLFSLAAARLPLERRRLVTELAQAVADAMMMLITWVLRAAPIGVFALALTLGMNLGLAAAEAILVYVALHSALCIVLTAAIYPAAIVLGRLPVTDFAAATLPVQAVAFSSRSSLASLPAAVEQCKTRLHLPDAITSFLLPLGFATFRIAAPVPMIAGACFIAHLYGISLGAAQLATMVVTSIAASFTVPGVPGGSVIAALPVLMSAGLPAEGLGILLAVDTIPDVFRTTANVTANMGVAVVLAKGE